MENYTLSEMLSRIKLIKKSKSITNEILAINAGISLGTLSKILAGVTKEPSIESVIKIARGLGTSADYLIFGSETKNNDIPPIFNKYNILNDLGQQKADEYIADLSEQPKYLKTNAHTIGDDMANLLKQDRLMNITKK